MRKAAGGGSVRGGTSKSVAAAGEGAGGGVGTAVVDGVKELLL